MNTNYAEYEIARCQEINLRARQAEKHQMEFYRDELLQTVKKTPVWKQAWNLGLTFFSRIIPFIPRHLEAQKPLELN